MDRAVPDFAGVQSGLQLLDVGAARIAPMLDAIPNFGRSFREPEQFAVFRVDNAFVNQEVHVKARRQYFSPTSTMGSGLILRVCTRVKTSDSSSKVP